MPEAPLSYRAYGLTLESELPLPELLPGSGTPDVHVRYGRVDAPPKVDEETGTGFWIQGEEACHRLAGSGSFLARQGREITVDPDGAASPLVLRLAVLGPAMGLILHQRGKFLLHASAVSVSGQAVAFLGAHASGKSTMASLMHTRGHELISDDVTAIEFVSGSAHAVPSYPQTKLWPDAARLLGMKPDELPRLHPEVDKFAWRPSRGVADSSRPLKRLYVLAVGPELQIRPTQPTEGFSCIMQNWYGARFGPELLSSLDPAAHFRRCTEVAKSVTTRILCRLADGHPDPASLEACILRDLEMPTG